MTEKDFKAIYGNKLLFNVPELMEMLCVGKTKIYELIEEGILTVLCRPDGTPDKPWRVYRASVLKYLIPPAPERSHKKPRPPRKKSGKWATDWNK